MHKQDTYHQTIGGTIVVLILILLLGLISQSFVFFVALPIAAVTGLFAIAMTKPKV